MALLHRVVLYGSLTTALYLLYWVLTLESGAPIAASMSMPEFANIDSVYTKPRPRQTPQALPGAVNKECKALPGVRWYGEQCQDESTYMHYFAGMKQPGVYIEAGAVDGDLHSLTKALEMSKGWAGILIEADPKLCEELKVNRPGNHIFCVALCSEYGALFKPGAHPATGGLVQHARADGQSGSEKTFRVPCRLLAEMIRHAGLTSVDLLVLSVEGAELDALKGMAWDVGPRVILVSVKGGKEQADAIGSYLHVHGYVLDKHVGDSQWWRLRSWHPSK